MRTCHFRLSTFDLPPSARTTNGMRRRRGWIIFQATRYSMGVLELARALQPKIAYTIRTKHKRCVPRLRCLQRKTTLLYYNTGVVVVVFAAEYPCSLLPETDRVHRVDCLTAALHNEPVVRAERVGINNRKLFGGRIVRN